jgi:NADH-quinone oxidoreductase subunit L
MSGLRRVMPITHLTMLVGCLALAGVPGLAGFFSKDEIIHAALNSTEGPGFVLGLLSVLVAFMTAYYTFRLFFRVFWGPLELPPTAGQHEPNVFALADEHGHEEHGHGAHGHEEHGHGKVDPAALRLDGSPLLWAPLVVLALGAIFAGYLGTHLTGDWIHHFLAPVLGGEGAAEAGEHAARVGETFMLVLSFVLSGLGIATAFYFYCVNRHAADIVAANLKSLVAFLYNKWYIDELYAALLLRPLRVLGHIFNLVDRYVVDGLVFLVGFAPQVAGYSLKPTQRGILQRYALGMVAGAAAVVLGVLYLMR